MTSNQPKKLLNIAFLVDWVEREYQIKLLQGATDAARRHGVNLFCLEGGILKRNPDMFYRNRLYELVNPGNIDGLIIATAVLGNPLPAEELKQFCSKYLPLPIVSIGAEIEGCSSVLVDNSGLRDAINHLIRVHHYRKFAMIAGPQNNRDAQLRLAIFRQALAEHGLVYDPNLVVEGTFWKNPGRTAVQTLINERKATFDALVVFNDEMAFTAIAELQARGIKVPDEVGVIGFDNLESYIHSNPPLTTVNVSTYEEGAKAVDLLLELISTGSAQPRSVSVTSRLVLRESCGCLSQIALQCNLPETGQNAGVTFKENKSLISAKIFNELQPGLTTLDTIDRLLEALLAEVKGQKKFCFLKTFQQVINEQLQYKQNLNQWQNLLSILLCKTIPYLEAAYHRQVDLLIHRARIIISEKAYTSGEGIRYNVGNRYLLINHIGEILSFMTSIEEVMDVLCKKLPQIGVTTCYAADYNPDNYEYRILMAYNEQGKLNLGNTIFSGSLMPEQIASNGEPRAFLISMIHGSKERLLTLAIGLEQPVVIDIHAALLAVVSSTLRSIISSNMQEKKLLDQKEYLLGKLGKTIEGFIRTILLTMEVRDPYTAGHQSRVADLACAIATEMKLSRETVEGLRMAGMIHDLGKIAIPVEILNKPGRLSPVEFALIKGHPTVAYNILENIDFPWPIAKIVAQHHERIDGSGYPAGLNGQQILPEAKILAVADVIEAMASHRPYRPALGLTKALDEIRTNRGKLYDSKVVDTCLDLFLNHGYQLEEQGNIPFLATTQ